MPNNANFRHTITAYLILLYFVPLIFLVLASTGWIGFSAWQTLILGLLIASVSCVALILKIWQWSNTIIPSSEINHETLQSLAKPYKPMQVEDVQEDHTANEMETANDIGEEKAELLNQVQLLQAELEETQKHWNVLNDRMKQKEDELAEVIEQKKALENEFEQMREDFTGFQEESYEQLKQKELLLAEYANTVQELRDSIDKKQQQVSKLESSVSDLTFEVKTLLQLSDVEKGVKEPVLVQASAGHAEDSYYKKPYKPSFPNSLPRPSYPHENVETTTLTRQEHETRIKNQQEASVELRKCIEIAQKITGASHLATTGRIPFGIDSYALDQRRLYDGLRTEVRALVIVYSPRDDKLLFANAQVKALLGWSPERFLQDFNILIKEGFEDWKRIVHALVPHQEAQVRLLVKTRIGHDQILQGRLAMIPFGSFKGHIISVFFTS